ncbi:UTRA domain-containing protein [Pelagimonas varians]|uniref:Mannosyl-D-glycerate transport/metabolism system repressor MngR n=1 Tax=Pelagimonas varians TaxID=696760 RepID=A0A238KPI2_9RHOB|nr:UTRA domain-containing protein [Pelagimonas varians]PYG28817.1 GntR family transcriptional regulator [Pelagimonas varians]SMX44541.1 Mannosyl-D-glycerate transport/metabolism system repressor MngR [Pelagimonas varians]
MKATYKEVKSDILAKIVKGDWGPGDLVPNEVDLAVTYGCARATVNRAMRELADDGIIERRRKAGTRVRMTQVRQARFDIPLVRDEVKERGADYRYSLVSHEVEVAPDWLRARLQLPVGGKALHLVCMHYADGVPYEHENRWINLSALPSAEGADFSQECPTEWLLAAIPFSKAEINLSAELADQKLSDYLACSVGDPIFSVERSTWWEGDAVTFVRLSYRPGYRLTTRY